MIKSVHVVSHVQPFNLLYLLRHIQFAGLDKQQMLNCQGKKKGGEGCWRNEIVIVCFYICLLVRLIWKNENCLLCMWNI